MELKNYPSGDEEFDDWFREMELKNYPSGDEEFDDWFRETQPDRAAQIDAQIAKDEAFVYMLEALRLYVLDCEVERLDYNTDTYKAAKKALNKAIKATRK